MSDASKRTDKEWVENWRRIGPLLEKIKQLEMQGLGAEESNAALLPLISEWRANNAGAAVGQSDR